MVRVGIELLTPGRTGVGEQNVNMVGVLLDLLDQALDLRHLGGVRRDRDGDGTGVAVRERVQRIAGLLARLRFARGDEDLGAAGLEKTDLC